MKKIIALALAAVMLVAGAMTTMADLATEDATFTDKVADGSAGWNSAGTGVTFPINEDGVTVVFANDAFIRDASNWSNFVFETLILGDVKGITLRADAYGWVYGDAATVEPTWAVETSWGADWSGFAALTDNTDVTLTAKKTDANTVVFDIKFASDANAYEKYTVTYPNGVPADLSFQIGSDGGIVTLKSVDFPDVEPAPETPVVPEKGDFATVSVIVLVAGIALVAFASKKRFA